MMAKIADGYTEYDLFTVDNEAEYRYIDCENGVKVIGYSGLKEYLEIPEKLGGKQVVAIGIYEGGYPGSRSFDVLIPNTVTYIDPRCNPQSSKSWISGLFFKDDNEFFCTEDNLLYSKDKRTLYFGYQNNVDEIVIPEGVESIGEYAFFNSSIKSVSISASVRSIGSHAFDSGYYSVEIPDTVEKIGDHIAESYTLMGNNKFYKTVDGCVYTTDGKILVQCVQTELSQIVIPDTVEEIRPYAFYSMPIDKLDLGNGVKIIGEKAFYYSEVKTIRIPDQLVEMADDAFGYKKCNSVKVGKNNNNYFSDGKCIFAVDKNGEKRLIKFYKCKEEEYDIPEDVTSIAPDAFSKCLSMNRLTLPSGLQAFDQNCLPYRSFDYKASIKKIEIPASISELQITFDNYSYAISEENKSYFIENGILYHRIGDKLEIIAAKKVTGELVIKSGVI